MYNPYYGYRRQAEWDDHGETYPLTQDGHTGHNRMRDYLLEIFPSQQKRTKFEDWRKFSELAEAQVRKEPPLEKSRLRDFWGGVHKQFLVTGPGLYFVKINRNYSPALPAVIVCVDSTA